jgi:hypothetical protein
LAGQVGGAAENAAFRGKELAMGFLFRLGLLLAVALFAWPKLFAPAPGPVRSTHESKQGSLAVLRQAAEERVAAAARDRCLKAPGDCVELLATASTPTRKPAPHARRSEKAASSGAP